MGCSGCSPASAQGTDDWVHSSVQLAHAWRPHHVDSFFRFKSPTPPRTNVKGLTKVRPRTTARLRRRRWASPRSPQGALPHAPLEWASHPVPGVSISFHYDCFPLLSAADCAGRDRDVRNFKFGSPTAIVVQVGSNNNCVGNSVVGSCVKGLAVAAGQTYYIVVDGFDADFGSVQLRLQFSSS